MIAMCAERLDLFGTPAVVLERFLGRCDGTKVKRRRPQRQDRDAAEGSMALPYSADLRERVLLAHEHGEGNAAAPSRASGGGAVSGGGQDGEELGAGRRDGGAAGRQTAGPRSGAASGRAGVRGATAIGGGRQRCDPGRIWCAAGGAGPILSRGYAPFSKSAARPSAEESEGPAFSSELQSYLTQTITH